jgi:hypothetical protein
MHTGEGFIFKGKPPCCFFKLKSIHGRPASRCAVATARDLLCEGLGAYAVRFIKKNYQAEIKIHQLSITYWIFLNC